MHSTQPPIACDEGCLLCKTDGFENILPVSALPLAGKGSTFTIRLPVNPCTPKVSSEFSRDNDGRDNGQFMGSSSPRATVEAGSWLVVLARHVISAVFRCVLPLLSCNAVACGCAVIVWLLDGKPMRRVTRLLVALPAREPALYEHHVGM